MTLTGKQRRAALALASVRPSPATQVWHDLVVRAIQREQVPTAAIAVFCEIAGVDGAERATVGSPLDHALVALARSKRRHCVLCNTLLPHDNLHVTCDSCIHTGKLL